MFVCEYVRPIFVCRLSTGRLSVVPVGGDADVVVSVNNAYGALPQFKLKSCNLIIEWIKCVTKTQNMAIK